MSTSFSTAAGDGVVIADGFVGGSISGASNFSLVPQLIAAAGATQGVATAILGSLAILTVCTASARGIKLPTAATGKMVYVMSLCTQGVKVYPFLGDKIKSSATNTAVVLAGFKANLYVAKDTLQWGVLVGA